jgi:hypothetical protein
MRILFTVNLDGDFRAGDGAQRTAGTLFASHINDGAIALGIIIRGRMDVALFTGVNAKMAFLAAFEVNCNQAFFQRGRLSF